VSAISENFKEVDILDVYSEEWSDYLNIDLQMRPSLLFDKGFRWHSKAGLPANFKNVIQEFALYRGFSPIKVGIIGPPLTGKSALSNALQKGFGLEPI